MSIEDSFTLDGGCSALLVEVLDASGLSLIGRLTLDNAQVGKSQRLAVEQPLLHLR